MQSHISKFKKIWKVGVRPTPDLDADTLVTRYRRDLTGAEVFIIEDIADLGAFDSIPMTPELLHLPYPITAIDVRDPGDPDYRPTVIFCAEESDFSKGLLPDILHRWPGLSLDTPIISFYYVTCPKEAPAFPLMSTVCWAALDADSDTFRLAMNLSPDLDEEDKKSQQIDAEAAWRVIEGFLIALSCKDVEPVKTVIPQAVNNKRRKHGKTLLSNFWTLRLSPSRTARTASGTGHHASPRLHWRRGHVRRYASGLITWVQPTMVGDPKKGKVSKEYIL